MRTNSREFTFGKSQKLTTEAAEKAEDTEKDGGEQKIDVRFSTQIIVTPRPFATTLTVQDFCFIGRIPEI